MKYNRIYTWRVKMSDKVLILGLSRSGIAAAKYAKQQGHDVYVTEGNAPKEQYLGQIDELRKLGINIETGKHSDDFINNSSFAVTSPGIPPKSEIFQKLKSKNIPIISEIEYAYRNTKIPFIVITGTNGKTTTTALVSHILSVKYDAPVCGNIGVPPTSLINENHDFLVCEVSSYQAEVTKDFKAKIACWTNFTPDHIDWHGGLDNYFKAKAKLFLGSQAPEYSVLNASDSKLKDFSQKCKNVVFFDDEKDCYIKNNTIFYKGEQIITLNDCPLLGHHNHQNP